MDSVSQNYTGDKGRQYALGRSQDKINHFGHELQSRFYTPWLKPDDEVLDFGCGSASITKVIQKKCPKIEGLEVNAFSREIARTEQGMTVHASLADIPQGKQFDKIISNHVLEHIPDVCGTLKSLRHLLKPGGQFITVLPLDDFREKNNRKWFPTDPNHHIFTWTPLLFGNLLVEAGFRPVECKVITYAYTGKLFWLGDTVLLKMANWAFAIYRRRRQLFAIATPELENG
jgi:SAM-dependent methyltransferase